MEVNTKMTKGDAEKKVLQNKEILLKPITSGSGRGFFKKGHDGEFMFTGCKKKYTLPWVASRNSYYNIFNEPGEQEAFEILLNRKHGELNLYDRKNKFWGVTILEIDKNGRTLNLSNPVHALLFKIAKANIDFIAPSVNSRYDKASYQYMVVDGEVAEAGESKLAAKTERAMDLFHDIKKSKIKCYNILRLMDKKPNPDSSIEWLKTEIIKVINQKEKTAGTLNIDDFIFAAEDKQASSKIFVLDAIDAQAISAIGGNYRITETNQLIGKSLQGAVDWMDDSVNQDDRLLIESKIKRNKR